MEVPTRRLTILAVTAVDVVPPAVYTVCVRRLAEYTLTYVSHCVCDSVSAILPLNYATE